MIDITFPDGSVKSYEKGITGYEIAQSISPRLAAEVLAVNVRTADDTTGKGTTYDLSHWLSVTKIALTAPLGGVCSRKRRT